MNVWKAFISVCLSVSLVTSHVAAHIIHFPFVRACLSTDLLLQLKFFFYSSMLLPLIEPPPKKKQKTQQQQKNFFLLMHELIAGARCKFLNYMPVTLKKR